MKNEYDVIIIGSGPAGSSAAKSLTQWGLKTLILEKEQLPRYKCCSGVLFGEAQALLQKYFGGLPPEEVYCTPKIINASNVQVYKEGEGFPSGIGNGLKKPGFFQRLFEHLARSF